MARKRSKDFPRTRSPLEAYAWRHLEAEGIKFEYEKSFELFPPFSFDGLVLEKTPKNRHLHIKRNNLQDIEFTPDFIGDGWVMEVKGLRRPDFNLRWKIFKNLIKDKGWLLMLPTSQKDVHVCIDIIKRWTKNDRSWDNEKVLRQYQNFQQPAEKHPKPKAVQVKKGKTGTIRKRRQYGSTSGFGSGLLIDESFFLKQ